MLEAHIASPRGSFYYAGESSPYDLETLRQHLKDSVTDVPATDVRLELVLDDEAVAARIAPWIGRIEQTGVHVTTLFAYAPGARFRLAQRPVRREADAPETPIAPTATQAGC